MRITIALINIRIIQTIVSHNVNELLENVGIYGCNKHIIGTARFINKMNPEIILIYGLFSPIVDILKKFKIFSDMFTIRFFVLIHAIQPLIIILYHFLYLY